MIEWFEKAIDFSNILNTSITASWLILVVIGLRLILKRAPKWINVALWGIVALRLLMPFSIESSLSLVPSVETVSDQLLQAEPEYSHGEAKLDIITNPNYGSFVTMDLDDSMDCFQWSMVKMSLVWHAGIAAMSIYTLISFIVLRRKLRTAVILRDNLFQCETVSSPFVLGILKPKIYLPYAMDDQNLSYVIAHEQAHIRRKDHWWKPLGFLLLTIHWFNPLMWVAYILLCRDIELACDEKVIAELGNEQRADYTQALVACAVNRRIIAACPLAFGEVGVKERVKSVMNYKKPTFWLVVTALAACVVVAVCFLTNPLDSVDYLKFTGWSNDPTSPDQMNYEISLGNKAMSGEIYVEQWITGTCIRSAPVVMTQFVDSIHLSIRENREGSYTVGTDIRIETNQYGGSLTMYIPYPENIDDHSYYYARSEHNKRTELSPGKEVILEARSYQFGNSVRPFTCETLIEDPEILKTADYMIVIRAVFSDDHLGVTDEEPVSAPYTVLRATILEIHDGYFLVEPVEGSWEISSASRIEVPMKNMSPSPEPQVGDVLQIEYDGEIQETYPVKIPNVFHIALERTVYNQPMTQDETLSNTIRRKLELPGDCYITYVGEYSDGSDALLWYSIEGNYPERYIAVECEKQSSGTYEYKDTHSHMTYATDIVHVLWHGENIFLVNNRECAEIVYMNDAREVIQEIDVAEYGLPYVFHLSMPTNPGICMFVDANGEEIR